MSTPTPLSTRPLHALPRLPYLLACLCALSACTDDPTDTSTPPQDTEPALTDTKPDPMDTPSAHMDTEDAHMDSEPDLMDTEDAHMDTEDAHMDSEDAHMDSEDAHMDSEDAHMDSEDAHMDSEDAHMDSDTGPPPPPAPARYTADRLRSPMTAYVAARLRDLYDRAPAGPRDDVFIKVGASGTVSTRLVSCFAPSPPSGYTYDLDGRDHLQTTINHFRALTPAGATSFDRVTLAAEVGRTASWAISGSPSPLQQELTALNPRFALVNYGTNDMGMGATYQSALWPFVSNMTALLDQLTDQGVIPIVTGLNPRDDSEGARVWAQTYNDVTRALAEQYQVPYIDLLNASTPLANMGLLSDGIHGNSYSVGGGAQPCVFTPQGLGFNYNARNLLTLEALHDARALTLDRAALAPDPDTAPWQGDGSPQNPYVIDRLPFSHAAETSQSPHSLIDQYPACDSGQDESGPEVYYRLTLDAPTAARVMVFDDATTDVDLHHLTGSDAASCVARHDRILQGTLPAGDHLFVVDTFVSAGTPRPGPYLLVVSPCDLADTTCR